MTKLTARRILLLFGALVAIFIAFGLATAGRDPIQRTYGEAGRELENAMDRLSDIAVGCSTEIVASAPMGGASVGCTTPQAIRVALVAFGDVRTRDRAAAFPCRPLGGPVITPRGTPWLIETYSDPDAESVRRALQQAGIALATPPACEDGITLLPADPPGGDSGPWGRDYLGSWQIARAPRRARLIGASRSQSIPHEHLRLTRALLGASLPMMTDDYTHSTYGDRIAGIYDERYLGKFAEDTAGAVSFLKELAGEGPALELGIGTGRVALPLAEAGVEVHGIDASEAMLAKLKAKPGSDRIPVTVGSFADFSFQTRFRLVYVVFNTFFGLLTQDEQVSCFEAVARHLTPDGVFAMQAFVPDVTRFDAHNQRVAAESVGIDEVTLETSNHDPFAQRTDSAYVRIRDSSVRMYPVRIRYAYVSELDLMARLAGLRLRERCADWDRQPYPSRSWTHVSVWGQVD